MMWNVLQEKFKNHPAQEKVVRLLLERGFQVNAQGRVVSGNIEIAHTQIANEIGVDRKGPLVSLVPSGAVIVT